MLEPDPQFLLVLLQEDLRARLHLRAARVPADPHHHPRLRVLKVPNLPEQKVGHQKLLRNFERLIKLFRKKNLSLSKVIFLFKLNSSG